VSFCKVSKITGRLLSGVLQRRLGKRIPLAVRQRRLWTPAEDKLSGSAPDAEIAARFDRTIKAVEARRLVLR
jgi:hypothetical protein